MKRLALTLMVAAAALLSGPLASAGVAQAYPPGQVPTIRVNVSSVRTSEPFTVTIDGSHPMSLASIHSRMVRTGDRPTRRLP